MAELLPLKPLPAPDDRHPFVERPELQLIADKVTSICEERPSTLLVTCFWGVAGIGKSWLLGELARMYQRDGPRSRRLSDKPPLETVAARLDFDRSRSEGLWPAGKLDCEGVIRELWRQLALEVGVAMPDLNDLSPEEQANGLVHAVPKWLDRFRPLILFDTFDDVIRDDEAAFYWLEEHLVEPLALTNRVLLVFASRGELRRWKRFQVRRRVDLWPLDAFDALAAKNSAQANAGVGRVLYHHAFGHPLATEYLARLLAADGLDPTIATAEEAEARLARNSQRLLRDALEAAVQQYILTKVPARLAHLAQAASVLRWVNVEPLQSLVEGLGWQQDLGTTTDYHDLIGELQAYHLLHWDLDEGTYKFPSGVGRLLAHALEVSDPACFSAAHRAAYDFHRGHVEDHSQYLAAYVPEAAYHCSILERSPIARSGAPAFGEWWEKFLATRQPRDKEPWKELEKALNADDELRETMQSSQLQRLVGSIQERIA